MSYWNQLGFLERGMQAGAIPGADALSTLMELDAQRQAQRQARKQAAAEAQSGALDSLMGNALAAAGEPTSMQDVLRLTQAETMFGAGDPQGALDQLFLPQGSRYEGNWGQSRIDPSLRPEDIQDIEAERAAGTPPQLILSGLQELYGPKTYARLLPEIQTLLGL